MLDELERSGLYGRSLQFCIFFLAVRVGAQQGSRLVAVSGKTSRGFINAPSSGVTRA